MGNLINTQTFLNENIFRFEKRLESQYTIFTEKTPTFVTYYHINNINSVTDSGLLNIDRVIGQESPLRFEEIKDFPIYGIDQIQLALNDEDEGLQTNFEGDGIILPNTVHPYPNDFFIISYLDQNYLFMITSIDYDTIKSNNYYKIGYIFRSGDQLSISEIHNQILEQYNCVFENIGTEDNCLIRSDAYARLEILNTIYNKIVTSYLSLFYNKRYNCFIFNSFNEVIYDKFISNFISTNNLLYKKNSYDSIVLTNEDYGEQFPITYENSIFTAIEERDKTNLKHIFYTLCPITYQHSIFLYYNLKNVKSLVFTDTGVSDYIDDDIIDNIINNTISVSATIIEELLVAYFNDTIESIFQIDITKLQNYKLTYSMSTYSTVPILLYIIKYYINKFLHM